MFEDLINQDEIIKQLKIDCESMAFEISNYVGHTNILSKKVDKMFILMNECKFFMDTFKKHVDKTTFKICETEAEKLYNEWAKEQVDEKYQIGKPEVKATVQP
jgi:hypothetical protein